jgi:hypothetical protein
LTDAALTFPEDLTEDGLTDDGFAEDLSDDG